MGRVYLRGIDRPGLGAALAERGLSVDGGGAVALQLHDVVLTVALSSADMPLTDVRRGWAGRLAVLLPRADDAALVDALDAGADEAIPQTASDALIAARLAALLRRATPHAAITFGPLLIDPVERRVTRDGQLIDLLPREYRLLLYLLEQAGRPVARAELLRAVWGLNFDPGTNVVEVHVSRLRARLDRGFAVPLLRTAKGRGYFLAIDTPAADLAIAAPPADR
jgi:two-component system OmpR family response regulator